MVFIRHYYVIHFLITSITSSLYSKIYCYGPLLHTVQMAKLYPDSKTFVDKKLKFPPEQTLTEFNTFMEDKNQNPTENDLRAFVDVST